MAILDSPKPRRCRERPNHNHSFLMALSALSLALGSHEALARAERSPVLAGGIATSTSENGVNPAQDTSPEQASGQRRTRAKLLIAQGRYAEAIGELDALLGAAPDDAPAYNDRGLARWRSLASPPAATQALDGFALLQSESCREGRTECGEVTQALADLSRAADLLSGPERATPFINRARIYAARGDLRRALTDYDAAADLLPQDASFHLERAQVRQQIGDTAGARADLDAALQLRPHDGPVLLQRAKLRIETGDLNGTRADLDEALHAAARLRSPPWFAEASALRQPWPSPMKPGWRQRSVVLRSPTPSRTAIRRGTN